MVQVDVFWSYGIGAGFALAAAHQLKHRTERRVERIPAEESGDPPGYLANHYLTGAILYCAAVFAPSGAWLLWGFPNWETMQVGDFSTIPAWLVALFAATNTTQGAAGFLVTQWMIGRGWTRWAALQVVGGYLGMFFILVHGWDGTGYQRFFSTDKQDFARWGTEPPLTQVREWATSDVALTLYGMGVVLIPLMLFALNRYYRQGLRAAGLKGPGTVKVLAIALGSVGGALAAAIVASLLIHTVGWILGGLGAAVLIWAIAVRRGGIASWAVRQLALPAEEPSKKADQALVA